MCNQLQNYENFAIAVLCRPVGCLTQPARLQCNGVQMLHDLRLMMNRLISGSAINDGASPKGATVPSPCGHIVYMWSGCSPKIHPKDEELMIRNGRITWNTSSQHRAAVVAVLHSKQSHQQHSGTDNPISLLQRKVGWLDVPAYVLSTLLRASVPALMYCWRPKMETGKWWQWNTQVYTACMYRTDYPATKTGMRIAYDAVLQFH